MSPLGSTFHGLPRNPQHDDLRRCDLAAKLEHPQANLHPSLILLDLGDDDEHFLVCEKKLHLHLHGPHHPQSEHLNNEILDQCQAQTVPQVSKRLHRQLKLYEST